MLARVYILYPDASLNKKTPNATLQRRAIPLNLRFTFQQQALSTESARKGGAVVLTGLSRTDALASIPTFPFVMQENRPIGSLYGSGRPLLDIPPLVTLYQAGELKLRELVTRTYHLDGVNDALAALAAGEGARGIIRW